MRVIQAIPTLVGKVTHFKEFFENFLNKCSGVLQPTVTAFFVDDSIDVANDVKRIDDAIVLARGYLATSQVISVISSAKSIAAKDGTKARSLKANLKATLDQKQNKQIILPKAVQQFYDEADFE